MIENLLLSQVSERFKNDERYREGHLRVINALPQRKVLGLHTPEMKKTAQEMWLSGGEEYIKTFEQSQHNMLTYEETVIWGYLINKGSCTLHDRFSKLDVYIPVLDNWAVCDSFCADAKWIKKIVNSEAKVPRDELWNYIVKWFVSKREFEVRFAIVVSMSYFLNEEWIDRIFEQIEAIDIDSISTEYITSKGKPLSVQEGRVQGAAPYYVRMAIAWLLATALAKLPDATRNYLQVAKLPTDVVKMYVQKVRDSYRTRNMSPF